MSMSADVRQALVDTPIGLSREQLFAETGAPDERKFYALLSQLKGCGKIKIGGTRQGDDYYVINKWPESALRETFDSNKPTQGTVSAKEFAEKGEDALKKSRPERVPKKEQKGRGEPAPAPAANGIEAQFAINAHGELGIEKGDTKIALSASEFSVLRQFVEKTEEVWK